MLKISAVIDDQLGAELRHRSRLEDRSVGASVRFTAATNGQNTARPPDVASSRRHLPRPKEAPSMTLDEMEEIIGLHGQTLEGLVMTDNVLRETIEVLTGNLAGLDRAVQTLAEAVRINGETIDLFGKRIDLLLG
jgi:hypothetical protein